MGWTFVEKNIAIPEGTKGGKNDDGDEDMKDEEECWLGNGYPGHAKTIEFMQSHVDKVFGYPNIVRFSWQTTKTILQERCAKVSFADETATNNLSKWGFTNSTKAKRSSFYKTANLSL